MATKDGPPKSPEAVAFIGMIAAALQVNVHDPEGLKLFAAKTGQEERAVYRWRSGKNAIALSTALAMLRAASLLRSVEEVVGAPHDPRLALERLGAAVADLTKDHRQALNDLTDVRTRLELAEAALAHDQAVPKRRSRKAA